MRPLLLTGFAAAFGLLASVPVQAQSADAAIAARKAGMDLVAATTASIKRTVDAKDDVKPMKGAAEALAAWGKAFPGLFVAGSDKGDTKAAAAAFSDHDGLVKAGLVLAAAGMKLSAAAEAGDKDGFAAAFKDLGAACGGCHRTYRTR